MIKLREVVRYGLPETNSSSSHSVVISKLENNKINCTALLPDKDGVIHIPPCDVYFGNCNFKSSNDSLIKLQLVISLLSNMSDSISSFGKKLSWIKEILCNFTGARDVVFEGISRFNEIYKNSIIEDKIDQDFRRYDYIIYESLGSAFGDVDHQSVDYLIDNIFENKHTILDFIFNPDSWLFLSSDCCDSAGLIEKVLSDYKGSTRLDCYISIDFGYNLGRVDFPIRCSYDDTTFDISRELMYSRDNFIQSLVSFNVDLDKFEGIDSNYSEDLISHLRGLSFSIPDNILSVGGDLFHNTHRKCSLTVLLIDNTYYLVLTNKKTYNRIEEFIQSNLMNLSSFYTPGEKNSGDGEVFKQFISNNPDLIENKDWKLFKMDIMIENFDNSQKI